jgi:hypothetical protein
MAIRKEALGLAAEIVDHTQQRSDLGLSSPEVFEDLETCVDYIDLLGKAVSEVSDPIYEDLKKHDAATRATLLLEEKYLR